MKIRKFFGPTSRAVLEQVRAELGPDAMIVANHASADGIEISAMAADALPHLFSERPRAASAPRSVPLAVGDDEGVTVSLSTRGREPAARLAGVVAARMAAEPVPQAPTAPAAAPQEQVVAVTPAELAAADGAAARAMRSAAADPAAPLTPIVATASATPIAAVVPVPVPPVTTAPVAAPVGAGPDSTERMMAELAAIRILFQQQMAELTWSDTLRRSPLRARVTRDLLLAGFSATLARTIVERLPDDFSAAEAQAWLATVLARNLPCIDPADELVTRGGIYALVGPTGVGKTTTTAKLAARCAVRYGAAKLALLTTDTYRVGAQDQLRIYAKILGVAVHTISDRHDLRQALDSVRGKHLVLIDTVGIGQRDTRVAEQSELLDHPDVARILLLNAAAQAETLEEVVTTYRRTPDGATNALAGAIVTKVDEAARTGGVLDVAIRHRLPLQYVTHGQRVPEDVAVPNAQYLIDRSLRAATRPTAFAIEPDQLALVAHGSVPHAG